MPLFILAVYLILCVLVAILGIGTRLGFFRCFLFAVLLTPFPVAIALLLLNSVGEATARSRRAGDDRP